MVNIIALIVSGIVTYVVYKYLLKKGEQKENEMYNNIDDIGTEIKDENI